MKTFWFLTYNLFFLPFFWLALRISSLFNKKIKTGIKARKDMFIHLRRKVDSLDTDRMNILIHCASLGEFEQAKPIIQELDRTGKYNFIVSFFSPSGFNHSKLDFEISSKIIKTYSPFDSVPEVKKFINILKPSAAIFIKYDLWLNFVGELNKQRIFILLANASVDLSRFKYRFFFTRSYKKNVFGHLDVIACTDDEDLSDFKKLFGNGTELLAAGDTKYERISMAKDVAVRIDPIRREIISGKRVFVIGSSWKDDEEIIFPVLNEFSSYSLNGVQPLISIIAPHEPSEDNLDEIEQTLSSEYHNLKPIRYSFLNRYNGENIILIDCIGILMSLYKYADIAYVGGGFQSGLHNVLEPAGYGIPVLFGNEKLSQDAHYLLQKGGGIAVGSRDAFSKQITGLLEKAELRKEIGARSYSVFEKRNEASKKIAEVIRSRIN